MTNNINHFKEIVNNAWIKHSKDKFRAPTTRDIEILIQTCLMPLALKTQNDSFIFVHKLKQEMHADLKYVESLENKIDELEYDKAKFSNMYDMILEESVSNEVMCTYLLSLSDLDALAELQCLYLHKVKEYDCLAQKLSKQTESVSNEVHNELLQRFAKVEKHSISLEIALPKCKEQIVHLILFIVDSRSTKHMTGNLKLLCNFVEKFLGTVHFGNDQFAPILGYGDLVQGNITINRVYYVEGLNHDFFSHKWKEIYSGDCRRLLKIYLDFVLRSKDETPEVLKEFLMTIQRNLQDPLITVRTDRDTHVPSQQELDLLFGPLYDEFFAVGTSSVNKSSSLTNNYNQQDTQPTTNIQPTSAPSTPTYFYAEENNDNQAEEEHLQDDEFTNPLCTPVQEVVESCSHNIGNLNVHEFNQPQVSEYRWIKDHPLEQVRENPSKPLQTRRQFATDPEMCMFALTVSTAEPKNIKEVMANSAWIEAMQEELHQFDRLQEEVYVAQPDGFVDPDHLKKVYRLRKSLYGLKQALRAWYDELSKLLTSKGLQIHQFPRGIFINQAKYALKILHKHGMDKRQSISTPMAMKPKFNVDLSGNPVDQTDYRSKIRSLLYLTSSRPDIVQAGSSFGLTAFSDADHARCIDTRKSTSGGIQFLGDKLVSWMSKKQDCTVMSLAKAEYVALSASCAQVMWMRTQLQDYGLNYNNIPLYCDSQSAISISCNPVQYSRTKHIHTRFKYLVRRIGMSSLTPAEQEVLVKESA
nr:hypothetical protein [Tanacetum cinerariifolium]